MKTGWNGDNSNDKSAGLVCNPFAGSDVFSEFSLMSYYSNHHHNQTPIRSQYAEDPDVREIVLEFVGEMPERILVGQRAFQSGDLMKLRCWAHQINGSAAGYGFPELSTIAAKLEVAIINKQHLDDVYLRLIEVIEYCERTTLTQESQ